MPSRKRETLGNMKKRTKHRFSLMTHSSLIRSELRTGEGGMDLKEISSEKKAILIKS